MSRVTNVRYDLTVFQTYLTHKLDTVSAAVTDGVTVGHPCCAEHECKLPLRNVRHEYCEHHRDMNAICCVSNCQSSREKGHRTCSMPEHRKQEAIREGMRHRVKKRSRPRNDECADKEDEEPQRRRTLPGTYSRKWTHNEQLMVRPCGIVIGRATFFNFEAMGAVKVCGLRNETMMF